MTALVLMAHTPYLLSMFYDYCIQLLCLHDLTGTRGNSAARLLRGWPFFTVMVLYTEVRSFLFHFQHWS